MPINLSFTGLSPSRANLPRLFKFIWWSNIEVLQPRQSRNFAGLGCSAFARHYLRNHYCFLFLGVLRCFSSPGSLPFGYYTFSIVGCPIQTSPDQIFSADPRSFSQLGTSFFASESLGIPHTLLFTFSYVFTYLFYTLACIKLFYFIMSKNGCQYSTPLQGRFRLWFFPPIGILTVW